MARAEPEIAVAERAFPTAQALFAGVALRLVVADQMNVGWHDTETHPKQGAFAVVADGAGLDELVGEILRIRSGAREVFVYVMASRAVPTPISLARRAFLALGLLSSESLPCVVEIVQ